MVIYGRRKIKRPPALDTPTVGGRVLLQVRVPPELREKARRAADSLDISLTYYVAELITRDVVDENGRPAWTPTLMPWTEPTEPPDALDLNTEDEAKLNSA